MDKTKEQIRSEIEETRRRMEGTVDALLYRADVPGRAKESLSQSRERAMETLGQSRERAVDYGRRHPGEAGMAAAGLAFLLGVGLWAARRW